MDNREIRLMESIRAYNENADKLHQNLVEAVNRYIDEGGDKLSLYPETERAIDQPATLTAWVYGRLDGRNFKAPKYKRIMKALGYN